ncbi:REP-associated tyrosine transposase [Rhodanobacter umsongensis]
MDRHQSIRAQGALLHGARPSAAGIISRGLRWSAHEESSGSSSTAQRAHIAAGHIYLLTTATADRTPWFLDMDFARAICGLMIEPKTWGDACPLCWVLMPDHWHGLVELGERDDLSFVMNCFKSVTSKCIQQPEQVTRIWARGFHDHALRGDEDIHAAARYIIANPLRAKLVDRAGDYPYWNCVWL